MRTSVSPTRRHIEPQDLKDRAVTLDLRKSSKEIFDKLAAEPESQRTPLEKMKSPTQTSFQGDKHTPHKEDRGRGHKSFATSFATPGSLGELSHHLGADLTKRMPRNGSFDAEFKKVGKETSNALYDIILHRSEVGSGAGAKTKGKILINSYLGNQSFYSERE